MNTTPEMIDLFTRLFFATGYRFEYNRETGEFSKYSLLFANSDDAEMADELSVTTDANEVEVWLINMMEMEFTEAGCPAGYMSNMFS